MDELAEDPPAVQLDQLAHAALRIIIDPVVSQGDFAVACGRVSELAAVALRVRRCSVWLETHPGRMRMVALSDSGEVTTGGDVAIDDQDYPDYFAAIGAARSFVVPDVMSDPRVSSLREPYFRPLGIMSLLDAPIRVAGEFAGVVCFEEGPEPRDWSAEEIVFAATIADHVAQIRLRARAARAIHEHEQLIELANTPIFGTDAIGRVNVWNRAMETITGRSFDEVVGADLLGLPLFVGSAGALRAVLHAALAGIPTPSHELHLRTSAEHHFVMLLNASTRRDLDGAVVGALLLGQDMTRLDEERSRLESAVEQRTVELEEALARVDQRNREREAFVSVISHDLKEPIWKMRAFGERLRAELDEAAVSEKAVRYLKRIESATSRLDELVAGLRAFGAISKGRGEMDDVSLGDVVARVVSSFDARLEEEEGAQVLVSQELPTVRGQALLFQQLFQNLIGNALKYAREGVPARIEITSATRDGRHEITVTDNGIGFEPEHAERIFGVFERLHGRGAFEGSGMGLAICRKIAELHDGQIRAESEPGRGSAFIVTLPIRSELP